MAGKDFKVTIELQVTEGLSKTDPGSVYQTDWDLSQRTGPGEPVELGWRSLRGETSDRKKSEIQVKPQTCWGREFR